MLPTTMPMQIPGSNPNSNILAGMPDKLTKKILNSVTGDMADALSQHAQEAVSQGVPWGHIVDQLLQMAPASARPDQSTQGMPGMSMAGGPPNGAGGIGQPPGGGGPPPQGPGPLPQRNDAMQAPVQSPSGANGDINAALTGQTSQGNQQLPQLLPANGFMSSSAPVGQNGDIRQAGGGMGMLANLLPGFFGNNSTQAEINRQTDLGNTPRSKLAMEYAQTGVPIKKAEEQKLQLENFYGLQKALIEKGATGLNPSEAAKFSALQQGQDAMTQMNDLLFGGSGQGKDFGSNLMQLRILPDVLKGQKARQVKNLLATSIKAENDAQGNPRQSDSAIEQQANGMMTALGTSKQTFSKAMLSKYKLFTNGLNIADPNGIHRQQASGQGGQYLSQVMGMKPPSFQGSQSNYVRTGTYNGRKVGMTSDGKVEFTQ